MADERYDDQAAYDVAVARIDREPALEEYRDIILYDWGNQEEHWQWIASAELAEIVDWCESIRRDEAEDELDY